MTTRTEFIVDCDGYADGDDGGAVYCGCGGDGRLVVWALVGALGCGWSGLWGVCEYVVVRALVGLGGLFGWGVGAAYESDCAPHHLIVW